MKKQKDDLERLVLWLEEKKLLWPTIYFLVLLTLTGFNAFAHDKVESGIIFFVFSILIVSLKKQLVEDFFGTKFLAVFIVLHIAIFELNPISLFITFIIFVVFRSKLKGKDLLPISIYLLADSISELTKVEGYLLDKLRDIGEILFFSPNFYGLLSVIPLIYLFIVFERYLQDKVNTDFLERYATFMIMGLLLIIISPFVFIYEDPISATIMVVILFLYILGMLIRASEDRKTDDTWLPLKGLMVRGGIMLILIIEVLILRHFFE